MEWDMLDNKYAGYEIKEKIRAALFSGQDTVAVFVLLGKNLERPPTYTPQFTHNWVNYEVGVAAGSQKPVWVFEQFRDFIHFPIPYVTDYAQYHLDEIDHIRNFSDIFRQRFISGLRVNPPFVITCPYNDCNGRYSYWNDEAQFNCPVCRRVISLKQTNS